MIWFDGLLAAPRCLAELGRQYDQLRENYQALKLDAKQRIARAEQKERQAKDHASYWMREANRVQELEKEVQRLRKLNGENYNRYVVAQDAYEQCRQGKPRRV